MEMSRGEEEEEEVVEEVSRQEKEEGEEMLKWEKKMSRGKEEMSRGGVEGVSRRGEKRMSRNEKEEMSIKENEEMSREKGDSVMSVGRLKREIWMVLEGSEEAVRRKLRAAIATGERERKRTFLMSYILIL